MFKYAINEQTKEIYEYMEDSAPEDANLVDDFPYEALGFDSPYDLIDNWRVYDYNGKLCANDKIEETSYCLSEDDWRLYFWSTMSYVWY